MKINKNDIDNVYLFFTIKKVLKLKFLFYFFDGKMKSVHDLYNLTIKADVRYNLTEIMINNNNNNYLV